MFPYTQIDTELECILVIIFKGINSGKNFERISAYFWGQKSRIVSLTELVVDFSKVPAKFGQQYFLSDGKTNKQQYLPN